MIQRLSSGLTSRISLLVSSLYDAVARRLEDSLLIDDGFGIHGFIIRTGRNKLAGQEAKHRALNWLLAVQ